MELLQNILVFDLGGVIIDLDVDRTINRLAALFETSYEQIKEAYTKSGLFADFETEADLFHMAALVVLLGLFALLFLFVAILGKIQDAAYGWNGLRRHFDEIKTAIAHGLTD